jgi:hypothetical protein
MKHVLTALVVVLTTVASLDAATITFERTFSLTDVNHFPAEPGAPPDFRARNGFSTSDVEWMVPAFDPALGTPLALILEVDTVLTFQGSIDFVQGSVEGPEDVLLVANALDPRWGGLVGADLMLKSFSCAERCDVLYEGPLYWQFSYDSAFEDLPMPYVFTFGLYGSDTFVSYHPDASADFRIDNTGVLRATYDYTAAPEPTSLLLLATGVLGALRSRTKK